MVGVGHSGGMGGDGLFLLEERFLSRFEEVKPHTSKKPQSCCSLTGTRGKQGSKEAQAQKEMSSQRLSFPYRSPSHVLISSTVMSGLLAFLLAKENVILAESWFRDTRHGKNRDERISPFNDRDCTPTG